MEPRHSWTAAACLMIAALLATAGCGTAPQAQTPGNGTRTPEPQRSDLPAERPEPSAHSGPRPAALDAGKLELRDADGNELYAFKPSGDDAAKFYDKDGKELCKLTFSSGKVKVKSPDDQPLFELKRKDDKVMVKDASGENELFKFKLKSGDIDFYAPGDQRLYRIRKNASGYRLEDNSDKTLFRAKEKDGKMVLRDLEDKTVLASKDLASPLGLLFFRIDELNLEQQAACLLFFLE